MNEPIVSPSGGGRTEMPLDAPLGSDGEGAPDGLEGAGVAPGADQEATAVNATQSGCANTAATSRDAIWHNRFDRLEARVDESAEVAGENYRRSLLILRDRAEAAESALVRTLLRPLGLRLALTVDSIDRFLTGCGDGVSSESGARCVDFVRHLSDDLVDTLDEFGVEEIEAYSGTPIDRSVHRVIAAPDGPEKHDGNLVVERRERRGYRIGERVIREADVAARYE